MQGSDNSGLHQLTTRGSEMSADLKTCLQWHQAGRLEVAERGYRELIESANNADAMQLLATLLHQRGQSAEALTWLDRALPHLQQRDAAESNRAAMLLALNRSTEALTQVEAVLQRNPTHRGARINQQLALAACAEQETDLIRKLEWQTRYAQAGGEDSEVWLKHANTLNAIGETARGLQAMRRARALDPDSPALASAELITAHFDSQASASSLNAMAKRAAALYASAARLIDANSRDARNWGFYSPRFSDGPIASLVLPVLRELKARGMRLALFSGMEYGDATESLFRQCADHWCHVEALDDEAFASQVAQVNVGVMFDLCGHAPGNRLAAFSARLAPLQVSWGDWFCSTGLANMDLFIADKILVPDEELQHFSERVIHLPTRFVTSPLITVNQNVGAASAANSTVGAASAANSTVGAASAANEHSPNTATPAALRFASFNRLSKLTEATLQTFAAILRAKPDATLLLRSGGLDQESVREHTRQRFATHGVPAQQLEFDAYGNYTETLQRYRDVRVALDPFPFNGCVTTLDALQMGVPVVCLRGNSLVARQSAALLTHQGCADWIADSEAEYIEIALRLMDSESNQAARSRFSNQNNSQIFDVTGFANALMQIIKTHQIS